MIFPNLFNRPTHKSTCKGHKSHSLLNQVRGRGNVAQVINSRRNLNIISWCLFTSWVGSNSIQQENNSNSITQQQTAEEELPLTEEIAQDFKF